MDRGWIGGGGCQSENGLAYSASSFVRPLFYNKS